MVHIGYHASHAQFPPSELLRLVRLAEEAGFNAALNSDHVHPWTDAQGQCGFAWSFMGAALATTRLSFGVVNAPGQRYHKVRRTRRGRARGPTRSGRPTSCCVWASSASTCTT